MTKSYPCGIILAGLFFVPLLTIGCATTKAYIGVQLDTHHLVKKVPPDKPAHQNAIRPWDIVLGIKKDKVEAPSLGNLKNSLAAGSVIEQIQSLPIGKPASIIISRNVQELTLPITATHPPPLPKHSRVLKYMDGCKH